MKTIHPFQYQGSIHVPKSKSYFQRALAIAALLPQKTTLKGCTWSNDAQAALAIIKQLGADCAIENDQIHIRGKAFLQKMDQKLTLNGGEAGLSTRMFSPIALLFADEVTFEGSGSILERDMTMVMDGMRELGIQVTSKNNKLPLLFIGPLHFAEKIVLDGSESSQFVTGALIALAFYGKKVEVEVKDLKSKGYVDMTLSILKHFGLKVEQNKDNTTFKIQSREYKKPLSTYEIEGDWSGASFHIVGAALNGAVTLKGLQKESVQADKAILEALEQVGAKVEWINEDLYVEKGGLKAFNFDATECPDLFPPLAALASCCDGISRIKGIHRLYNKESNRALTIQEELLKLGIEVQLEEDEMLIRGVKSVKGGKVSSRNDHRIAMMLAVLATRSESGITIEQPEAVDKSYPSFWEDLPGL